MSRDDFCRCTVEEFEAICNAYNSQREFDFKDNWERMRMLATIVIQPHIKGKMTPHKLLPFEWDNKPKEQEHLTKDERLKRAEEAKRKFGIE